MNTRERVAAAIAHRAVDRIPCGEISVDDAVVQDLLGCGRVDFDRRREFVTRLGLDIVCLSPILPAGGDSCTLPRPSEVDWPGLGRWVRETDRFVFVMLDGAFGWGTRLLGYEQFMLEVGRRSSALTDLILAVEGLNLELVARAAAAGAMGILVAEDIAFQQGLAVPPETLRAQFFPSLARQVSAIHDLGPAAFFHSDGNLSRALPDLVEVGFDGLQCLQAEAGMDANGLWERYRGRLCLWGSLSLGELVLDRTPGELHRAVDAAIPVGAREGGFIFGTSSGLARGVRAESLRTVYQYARTRGSTTDRPFVIEETSISSHL